MKRVELLSAAEAHARNPSAHQQKEGGGKVCGRITATPRMSGRLGLSMDSITMVACASCMLLITPDGVACGVHI